MTMPSIKGIPSHLASFEKLWEGRWKWSDARMGKLIEKGFRDTGMICVVDGNIYSATVVKDDIKGKPLELTLTSCNKFTYTLHVEKSHYDYVTLQAQSGVDLFHNIVSVDNAWKTIQSLLSKMRTPLLLKSNSPVTITPCEIEGELQSDIVVVSGADYNLENMDFHVDVELSQAVQTYHDMESILCKKMGIPATFLSRASGMGDKEVKDASAVDDIVRIYETQVRKDLAEFLGIEVEWVLGGDENVRKDDKDKTDVEGTPSNGDN